MAHDTSSETLLIAGRYELHETVGRGSMGTVYQGRDVVLDRPIAVKLLPTDATDPEHAVRFEQEARLLARLSHPGLVVVFDAGIDAALARDPRPYLVMELVRGRTLADRIKQGPMSPAEVATLASQLSSALAYIHRRGIVHRDIKPANILLAAADEPGHGETSKLTDFGIARLIDGTRMTMTGHTLGTANYVSPEQISGEDITAASDVYSLGLVLLECLTGEVAYPGHGVEAALTRLSRQPVIPDSVPDGWSRLLGTMTDRQASGRPGAAEVGVAVTGLAEAPVPDSVATSAMPTRDESWPDTSLSIFDDAAPRDELSQTRIMPTVGQPPAQRARPAWITQLSRPWLLAAALVVVLIVIIAVLTSGDPVVSPPRSPAYPTVPGQLGNHLRQLQQDVTP
jgi:serine/threonine protein kinase